MAVHELRRRYAGTHGFEAVRGISFEVEAGEVFALLGTNGAGKTSALEVIEGLAPPTSGTVRVLGHDPYRGRRRLRPRTGIMLQEGGFPSDLTALEVARMWHGLLPGERSPRSPAEALDIVDLSSRRAVAVQDLSGGERRRLDLALALMGRPEILFLDEPTTGLDAESRRTTWQLVRRLVADGATVLLTTHYLEEAEQLADRLAILRAGEIVAAGTPDQVVAGFPGEVRWRHEPGAPLPTFTGPGCAAPQVVGRDVVVRTPEPVPVLRELLAWADATGAALRGLRASEPSLETAFLAYADGASPSSPTSSTGA